VDAILEIERASFEDNMFSRRAVSYHIKNNLVLCAEDASQIVGYICLSPLTKNKIRRIYSIAVNPKHREKGIGEVLLKEAENKSKAKEIVLEVDETNSSAVVLYYRLGYVDFGRYVGYYGKTDAIRMKKVIK